MTIDEVVHMNASDVRRLLSDAFMFFLFLRLRSGEGIDPGDLGSTGEGR